LPLSRLLSLSSISAIAHRGGAKLAPENTWPAFARAAALGVDAIECDVHLSRDGEVVVIHDATLDRTTDATGLVAERTAAELARVDAGYRFGEQDGFPYRGQGIGIPRLDDLLHRLPEMPIVIEIKGDRRELGLRVIEVIREARAQTRVIVGGFSGVVLDAVRQAAPELMTSASRDEVRWALRRSYFWLPPARPAYQVLQVPLRSQETVVVTRRFVRAARRGGVPVQVWIVDDPGQMRRLIAWGVTGVISDRPDLAVRATRESRS
jgi:glycerophosphoryl diester phosphodiesterase